MKTKPAVRLPDDAKVRAIVQGAESPKHAVVKHVVAKGAAAKPAAADGTKASTTKDKPSLGKAWRFELPPSIRMGFPKQINLATTEEFHFVLKEYTRHRAIGPHISMQEFILLAVREKMEAEGVDLTGVV